MPSLQSKVAANQKRSEKTVVVHFHTRCVKDCGLRTLMLVFMPAQAFLKDHSSVFILISAGDESSKPTKHANKIIILIFLIMKATNLYTRGRISLHQKINFARDL